MKPSKTVAELQEAAQQRRAKLRTFVADMHAKRAYDLMGLESDPAAVRSIKAIAGRWVSVVRFASVRQTLLGG